MSIQTQLLGYAAKNFQPGVIWDLIRNSTGRAKDILRYSGSVVFGSWDKLSDASDFDTTIKCLKLAGAPLFSLWTAANGLRTYEEGKSTLHLTGNNSGSTVYSYAQSILNAISTGATVSGLLMPGGIFGTILRKIPILALAPGLLSLGMDHFQAIATCGPNHWLAKLSQVGLDNYLIDYKARDSYGLSFSSKLYPWWSRHIMTLDEKIFNYFGFKLRRLNPLQEAQRVLEANRSGPRTILAA